jgi:hypothetical protein
MNSDLWLSVILLAGWLILVGSGVWQRRQPAGRLAKQAALWAVIIGAMWAIAAIWLKLHR